MAREEIVHRDARELAGTSPTFRRIEIASIIAFPLLAMSLVARTWRPLHAPSLVIFALLTGCLASDFISGIFHWFFDTWFSPDTPYIGKAFVRTFREHHVDPTAICRHDFVETNGSNILSGGFLFVCGHWTDEPYVSTSFLFAGIFMSLTSQIHKWAHTERVPRVVAFFQRVRFILPKTMHTEHHAAPYDRTYCITNGWLNAPLHHTRFFRILEYVIRVTTGALPRRDDIGEIAAVKVAEENSIAPVDVGHVGGDARVVVAAAQEGFVDEGASNE
jgi:ubiquitin-conjugating enzyme E2 variant